MHRTLRLDPHISCFCNQWWLFSIPPPPPISLTSTLLITTCADDVSWCISVTLKASVIPWWLGTVHSFAPWDCSNDFGRVRWYVDHLYINDRAFLICTAKWNEQYVQDQRQFINPTHYWQYLWSQLQIQYIFDLESVFFSSNRGHFYEAHCGLII